MANIHFKTAGDLLKAIQSGEVSEDTLPDYKAPTKPTEASKGYIEARVRHLPVPDMTKPLVDRPALQPLPGYYMLPIEEVVLGIVLVNLVIWFSV